MKHLSSITIKNNHDNLVLVDCVIIGWGKPIRDEKQEIVWTDKSSGMCMFRNAPREVEFYHPTPDDPKTYIKVTLSIDSLRSIVREADKLSTEEFEDLLD